MYYSEKSIEERDTVIPVRHTHDVRQIQTRTASGLQPPARRQARQHEPRFVAVLANLLSFCAAAAQRTRHVPVLEYARVQHRRQGPRYCNGERSGCTAV